MMESLRRYGRDAPSSVPPSRSARDVAMSKVGLRRLHAEWVELRARIAEYTEQIHPLLSRGRLAQGEKDDRSYLSKSWSLWGGPA